LIFPRTDGTWRRPPWVKDVFMPFFCRFLCFFKNFFLSPPPSRLDLTLNLRLVLETVPSSLILRSAVFVSVITDLPLLPLSQVPPISVVFPTGSDPPIVPRPRFSVWSSIDSLTIGFLVTGIFPRRSILSPPPLSFNDPSFVGIALPRPTPLCLSPLFQDFLMFL